MFNLHCCFRIFTLLLVFICIVNCANVKKQQKNLADGIKNIINGLKGLDTKMITRRFNQKTLKKFFAKKPHLWSRKQLSDAQKQHYRNLVGSEKPQRLFKPKHKLQVNSTMIHNRIEYNELPPEFDARTHWPECTEIISQIQHQGNCKSCWAVASAAALSDRACIATQGQRKIRLSATELLTCCHQCHVVPGDGCQLGSHEQAFMFFEDVGIVTGAEHGGQGCKPYLFPADSTTVTPVPECDDSCVNNANYDGDTHYTVQNSMLSLNLMEDIMLEIYQHGPVVAYMDFFEDLIEYTNGLYYEDERMHNKRIGGHAVRILGWGETEGVPYWTVANSWGRAWGEQGTFKIARGINEVLIESDVLAAEYDIQRSSHQAMQ